MSEIKLIDKKGLQYTYLGCVHNGGVFPLDAAYIVAYDANGEIRKFQFHEITVNTKR
jgi:hypothetical protein